jgi:hypothetical protein
MEEDPPLHLQVLIVICPFPVSFTSVYDKLVLLGFLSLRLSHRGLS